MKIHGLMWQDITVLEMCVIMSLVLMMSVIHYPTKKSYFSRNVLCGGPEAFSSKLINRNHFFAILKFI